MALVNHTQINIPVKTYKSPPTGRTSLEVCLHLAGLTTKSRTYRLDENNKLLDRINQNIAHKPKTKKLPPNVDLATISTDRYPRSRNFQQAKSKSRINQVDNLMRAASELVSE